MYRILFVDDEEIIREGVSSLINWAANGLYLIGTAQNGLEAYEKIIRECPDIVITDIKMPGMDGLELISAVKEKMPEVIFVILSGYGEFDFAKRAMQNGVMHYILKPCDELEIMEVLNKVISELKLKKQKEEMISSIKYKLERVLPQVKEQFLRDYVITGIYNKQDCIFFKQLFNIEGDIFNLILFEIENKSSYMEKFTLKNILEEIFNTKKVYLSTIIGENILLLCQTMEFVEIMQLIKQVKTAYYNYYSTEISVAVSDSGKFENVPLMYDEAEECMKYKFYLGEGSIITSKDVFSNERKMRNEINFDYNKISYSIKAGDMERTNLELKNFFSKISQEKCENEIAKIYCIQLLLTIIRQSNLDEAKGYINHIIKFQEMNTLHQIFSFIQGVTIEITEKNYKRTAKKHNALIEKVIKYVHENIHKKELSLTWLAKEILYINVEYLGKLFYKEINEKFSQYVTRIRIEKAKELISCERDIKIYEVAQKTGFDDSSQYFSQVFKKYTGYTPTEYKNIT